MGPDSALIRRASAGLNESCSGASTQRITALGPAPMRDPDARAGSSRAVPGRPGPGRAGPGQIVGVLCCSHCPHAHVCTRESARAHTHTHGDTAARLRPVIASRSPDPRSPARVRALAACLILGMARVFVRACVFACLRACLRACVRVCVRARACVALVAVRVCWAGRGGWRGGLRGPATCRLAATARWTCTPPSGRI